ncbi:hypothetical protein N665_0308s0026 [Sinapis alba]|nr:hypothetical protein N665_0308s0026 [Sinapis alba]
MAFTKRTELMVCLLCIITLPSWFLKTHALPLTCDLTVHKEYDESPPEINHPSHQRHPLTLFKHGLPLAAEDDKCRLCVEKLGKLVYHCSICDFSKYLYCVRNPFELVVHYPKGHEHILTLMPRFIRFTCNACGLESDRFPYVCHQCDFMIHEDCIYLPCVIGIIRHRHHITIYDLRMVLLISMAIILVVEHACKICVVCKQESVYVLSCMDCDFVLDFKCATLPNRVRYKYDRKIIMSYTCERCYKCGFRCKGPFVAVRVDYDNGVVCSLSCLWKGDTFKFVRRID